MTEIVYASWRVPEAEGRAFRNPRFFDKPEPNASKVFVAGNWPKVERAYRMAGIPIVMLGRGEGARMNVPPLPSALADRISGEKISLGTDSGDQLSDDQLRIAIKEATGKAPHHKLGREKLIEAFNSINADQSQDAEASNGLIRREIEADLTAIHVDFDPRDPLEDLAALRDLAREERGA